jgi:hypothetical protein
MIDGVEVVRHGKVRRAKLYYLRGLSSRASRIKEKRVEKLGEEVRPPEPAVPEADLMVETGASTVATETPETEAPTAEAPVTETPKVETPKAEAQKAEAPKSDTPKTEEQAK